MIKAAAGLAAAYFSIRKGTQIVKDSINKYASFQQAVVNAGAATGKFGDELKAATSNVESISRQLGKETVFRASQAADAFYSLASAGVDVANVTKKQLKPILDLSAATQADLAFTTETTVGVIKAFELQMTDTSRVADVFVTAIGNSQAKIERLQAAFANVGPAAAQYNISLETSTAALSQFFDRNVDASRAGTAFRGILTRTARVLPVAEKALSRYGLTQKDISVETRGLIPVLETLKDVQLSNADAAIIFGQEYGSLAKVLIDSVDNIEDLEKKLEASGGTAELVAKEQLGTLQGSYKILQSIMEDVQLEIGKELEPSLIDLNKTLGGSAGAATALGVGITDILNVAIQDLIYALEDVLPLLEKVGGGLSLIAGLLQGASTKAKQAGSLIGGTFDILGKTIKGNFSPSVEDFSRLWSETMGPDGKFVEDIEQSEAKIIKGLHRMFDFDFIENKIEEFRGHASYLKNEIDSLNKQQEKSFDNDVAKRIDQLKLKYASIEEKVRSYGFELEKTAKKEKDVVTRITEQTQKRIDEINQMFQQAANGNKEAQKAIEDYEQHLEDYAELAKDVDEDRIDSLRKILTAKEDNHDLTKREIRTLERLNRVSGNAFDISRASNFEELTEAIGDNIDELNDLFDDTVKQIKKVEKAFDKMGDKAQERIQDIVREMEDLNEEFEKEFGAIGSDDIGGDARGDLVQELADKAQEIRDEIKELESQAEPDQDDIARLQELRRELEGFNDLFSSGQSIPTRQIEQLESQLFNTGARRRGLELAQERDPDSERQVKINELLKEEEALRAKIQELKIPSDDLATQFRAELQQRDELDELSAKDRIIRQAELEKEAAANRLKEKQAELELSRQLEEAFLADLKAKQDGVLESFEQGNLAKFLEQNQEILSTQQIRHAEELVSEAIKTDEMLTLNQNLQADITKALTDNIGLRDKALEGFKNREINRLEQVKKAALEAAAAIRAAQAASRSVGFASGGFTGRGASSEVAGVVHKNEYVIPTPLLKKLQPTGLINMLESMRRGNAMGFADGGFTSQGDKVTTINNENHFKDAFDVESFLEDMAYQVRSA